MNEPLSNFVKYKESVDNITFENDVDGISSSITKILDTIIQYDCCESDVLIEQKTKVLNELNTFSKYMSEFKDSLSVYLRKSEISYLSKSYELYESARTDTPEYIIQRFADHKLITNENIKKILIHDISKHCDWNHAGLIVRPSDSELYEPMVSLDPLYIADEELLLLDDIKSRWNELYQSRLRYNIISDESEVIFKNIPKSQLGFILITDFFNYKPIEIIKKYLSEIYGLLKPGGSLIFTYNNCNLPNAVRNFENMLYSYTPMTLVVIVLESIGFELTNSFSDSNSNTSWLEVKRPGTLSSLRGGQCIAKINV